jgi:hypothetical protein
MKISKRAYQAINSSVPVEKLFYVIDDTITEVSGKLIESASYIYDHASGKSVFRIPKISFRYF